MVWVCRWGHAHQASRDDIREGMAERVRTSPVGMCREGENQTSPAVVPKPHMGYLNPTGNLATQEL